MVVVVACVVHCARVVAPWFAFSPPEHLFTRYLIRSAWLSRGPAQCLQRPVAGNRNLQGITT